MNQPETRVIDSLRRPLASLRVSVTDRCNLRCRYCMPEEEYVWLPREAILSYEETARLVGIFSTLGVAKVRITGGEPLMRRDLDRLVHLMRSRARIEDLALTTNGVLLERYAAPLKQAGLSRVTVSLDTLRAERFRNFARRERLEDVLAGIEAARAAGFTRTKVNTVVVRGLNEDELTDLIEFGRDRDLEVRFIEYMDVGGATRWSPEEVVTRSEILERIGGRFGRVEPVRSDDDRGAPAARYRLSDGTVFGIISSTTAPFCGGCGRSRLTADGVWFTCLYADGGVNLRDQLRAGVSDEEVAAIIERTWAARTDRGAEERLAQAGRGPLFQLESLRADPHREMHTRGG
jgi:cyclic pyranopterin phosphate synthase